jgi:hypothetical protein
MLGLPETNEFGSVWVLANIHSTIPKMATLIQGENLDTAQFLLTLDGRWTSPAAPKCHLKAILKKKKQCKQCS